MKLFTIILFAVTYILMIALPKKRPYVALISAVIFVVSGAMPLASVFTAIDWNVLLMLAGTMGTVALFIESKMPERMADLLLQKTPTSCGSRSRCPCSRALCRRSSTTSRRF